MHPHQRAPARGNTTRRIVYLLSCNLALARKRTVVALLGFARVIRLGAVRVDQFSDVIHLDGVAILVLHAVTPDLDVRTRFEVADKLSRGMRSHANGRSVREKCAA